MKKLVVVSAIVLCGSCGSAFAQTTEAPAGAPPPPGATEREAVRGAEQPAPPRANAPNATGDDKVNGLEVPQMKNPNEGGRNQ